jgi:uncharacterized membrane-anchored protein YitT (DUF2179 family)
LDVLGVVFGSFILATAINVFLVPNEIAAGGVSGIATVLYLVFEVPLSATVLVANALLFIGGFAVLGKWELVKSLLGVAFLSVFLELTKMLPVYTDDLLMAAVFGGALSGLGIGITVSRGASTGGSDMLALMVCRKAKHLSVAGVILVTDVLVILISGFAFSSVTIMLYAAVTVYIAAKATDFVAVYGQTAKQIQIISNKAEEISTEIMQSLKRGTTGYYTKGMYTGRDRMTVHCVVNKREVYKVLNIVKEIDENAFVTIGDVREVIGEGFKEMEG